MMMERQTDYDLPDRFIANQKELLQVFHDKSANRIFGNGERMAARTAVEFNKAYLNRLQENTPEEQQDRVHRMPTLANNYAALVDWAQSVTASPQALFDATGIDNTRNLATEADFDPLGDSPAPQPDQPTPRRDDDLGL